MIGPALTAEVKDLSVEIIDHVNSNLDSLKVTSEKLRKQLIELFPKEMIFKIGFDEKGENYSAPENSRISTQVIVYKYFLTHQFYYRFLCNIRSNYY